MTYEKSIAVRAIAGLLGTNRFSLFSATDDKPLRIVMADGTETPVSEIEGFQDAYAAADKPAVPQTVGRAQARIALMQAGLLDQIEAALQALPEPPRLLAMEAWNSATSFNRNGTLINMLKSNVGLTDEQLDALFIAAAAIKL